MIIKIHHSVLKKLKAVEADRTAKTTNVFKTKNKTVDVHGFDDIVWIKTQGESPRQFDDIEPTSPINGLGIIKIHKNHHSVKKVSWMIEFLLSMLFFYCYSKIMCLSGGRLFRATPTGRARRARSLGVAKTDSPVGSSFGQAFL